MAELPKYRVVAAEYEKEFQDKLNILAGEGYIVHQFAVNNNPQNHDQSTFYAVMKIDEGSYEGVTNLRDVVPELVDECLANNWEICSTSLSTKFVRMIRRRKA